MTALPAPARTKLAKLLGMLGSDHPGERDNAAQAAHRIVTGAGLSWRQVIEPPAIEKKLPELGTWRATCAALMRRSGDLRPWERKFVADLPAFPRISTKHGMS